MNKLIKLKYLCKSFNTPIIQQELNDQGLYEVYGAAGIAGYLDIYNVDIEYLGIVKDGAGVGRVNKYKACTSLLGTMAYIIPNDQVDIDWLKYAVLSMDLGNDIGKTTIPHIYFSNYGNNYVRCVTYDKQMIIARYLEKKCIEIDNILDKTRASIEEYKKLKQATITQVVTKGLHSDRKMKDCKVDWIQEIPIEWKVQRIKNLFYLRDEKNYLPLEEVNLISLYTDLGVIQHSELEKTAGNKATNADGYKIVYENDIVVNIILCWMGAIGRSAYNGVTSPAYDIYIPRNGVESRFYHYYFRTRGFGGDCYKRGKGIMAMRWRTYSEQFRDICVVYPPLGEQIEIVNYLDEKCTEIDNLIAKKEQYLAEIENYKKSLIYEYVTGKKDVPQKYQT